MNALLFWYSLVHRKIQVSINFCLFSLFLSSCFLGKAFSFPFFSFFFYLWKKFSPLIEDHMIILKTVTLNWVGFGGRLGSD